MSFSHDELERWDREHVWHAFTQMAEYEPLLIDRAEGCKLFDVHGRAYLDGVSSLWCNVHGHRHPLLDAALRHQLDQVAHVTNLGLSCPITIQLAKKLTDVAPEGLKHVFFSSDGSSAVEVALKMCFQYWRQRSDYRPAKTKFLAFGDAYHGDTLGSVSVSGVERFQKMFEPLLFDVVRMPAPATYRLPAGITADQACGFYLNQLEQTLLAEHQQIAGVVIEPLVQCAAGIVTHPPGFLSGVRELTRRFDVLLIADEVATGFGRTGTLFACEREHVSPDFLCLGKGLTAGYLPMAATLATNEIWRAFLGRFDESKTFFHGHTYGGNPLAAAVALASLDVFRHERTLSNVASRAQELNERLAVIGAHPHVGNVRQQGLIAGIELVQNKETAEPYNWAQRRGQRVCDFARSQGVWLRPLGNVVVIMPPLVITADELEVICNAVAQGIEVATAN